MTAVTITLPASLHKAAREIARHDGVSLNQLIATALAEKISALKTLDYLRERAQGADEADWDAILAAVPDVEPASFDRLPRTK